MPNDCFDFEPGRTHVCMGQFDEFNACGVGCIPCNHDNLPVIGSPIDGLRWGAPSRYTHPGFRRVIAQSPPRFEINEDGEVTSTAIEDWTRLGIVPADDGFVVSDFRDPEEVEDPDFNLEWQIETITVDFIKLCLHDDNGECEFRFSGIPGTGEFRILGPALTRQRSNPRSADGRMSPWKTNDVWGLGGLPKALIVTENTVFAFGTCYDHNGKECFGFHPCFCWPIPPLDVDHCQPAGGVAPGFWPDCFHYSGYGLVDVTCRLKNDHLPYRVTPKPSTLTGRLLEQMCTTRVSVGSGCVNNWAINNIGHDGRDSGCFDIPDREYYVDGSRQGGYSLWDTLDIRWATQDRPRLLLPPDIAPVEIKARVDAGNAAILKMQSAAFPLANTERTVKFDRVDHPLAPATNSNHRIDLWSRSWSATTPELQVEVPGPNGVPWFSQSYLVKSGCLAPTRLMIRAVSVSMSLVFHRYVDYNYAGSTFDNDNCWISARARIELDCVPFVDVEDLECLETHGIEISRSPTGRPIITGDKLRYVDHAGRDSEFPWFPMWQGGMGQRIFEEWRDVWGDFDQPSTTFGHSCTIACGMSQGEGYEIGPWPIRRRMNRQDDLLADLFFDVYEGRFALKVTKAPEMCGCGAQNANGTTLF